MAIKYKTNTRSLILTKPSDKKYQITFGIKDITGTSWRKEDKPVKVRIYCTIGK